MILSGRRRAAFYSRLVLGAIILSGLTAVFLSVLADSQQNVEMGFAVLGGLFLVLFWDIFLNSLRRVAAADAAWIDPKPTNDVQMEKALSRGADTMFRVQKIVLFFITLIAVGVLSLVFFIQSEKTYSLTSSLLVFFAAAAGYVVVRIFFSRLFPGLLKNAGGGMVTYVPHADRVSFEFSFLDVSKFRTNSITHDVMFSDLTEIVGFQNPGDAHTYFIDNMMFNDFLSKVRAVENQIYTPGFKLRYYTNSMPTGGRGRRNALMAPALLLKGPETLLFLFLNQDSSVTEAVQAFEQYKRAHR